MTIKAIKIVDHDVNNRVFQMAFYPLDQTPPAEAGRLIEFYTLWNDLRGENKIPSRSQINFESLKGWHSNIRLADLGADAMSQKKNLILGETYKQYWGSETMFKQIIENESTTIELKRRYEESLNCFLDYNYGLSIGVAPNESGSRQKIIWIDLPLSTDDDKITHLITALIPQI